MKKSITRIMAALALLVTLAIPMGVWGQSDYSSDYTGNITLSTTGGTSASNCVINISDHQYNGIKAGTSSNAGAVMITVPSGTKYLHIHAAAWNNTTCSLAVTPEGYSSAIALTANSGIANNSPFTFNGNANTSDYYKVITFSSALTSNTNLTFTATDGKRFVIWGVTSEEEGSSDVVATPTFNPAAGTYTSAQTVSINCSTEGATIYYTTDGNDPTTSSTTYSAPINVSSNTTIKAMAAKSGFDNSAVATAEYAFITLDHAGTLEDPYTVADARAAIDANVGTQGVYATGIVSAIPTAWSSQYNNITFNFVDEEGDEDFLQAYRCASGTGVDASQVAVGDIVVVYGNLTKYGQTYEFAQGCELVSLTASGNPSITADDVNIAADATTGSIAYTVNNPATNGSMAAVTASDWLTLGTSFESPIAFTCTANTATSPRTATVTLTYTYNTNQTVTKEVTVTQAAYEAPHVTWDLSIASYASASEDQVTWTSDYATMVVDKANAGTNANNYLGGNQSSTRFYKNSKLTLSPVAGYAITSAVFTATTTGYASALQGSAWTNATATMEENGTIVTVTPADGTLDMVATIGGTCGFTSVTVYYVVNNTPSITVSPAEVNLDAGEHLVNYLNLSYENIEVEGASSFTVHYYNAEGEEIQPEPGESWMVAGVVKEDNYQVLFLVVANEGEARTAYFKVSCGETYSNLVTINQAGVAQQYTLTVEPFENLDLITFVNDEMVLEGDGEIQVTNGDQIMLSIVAAEGYVMETLMVNGVNHVNDIADDFTYTFEMPAEDVTISATAVEDVAPTPSNYVRISSLDQLTDGSKVIIAARHNATVNSYYAMKNATSGRPEGTSFTSMTSGNDEVVASTITDNEGNYYWTVNVTENGYTFTNASGNKIGYNNGTEFQNNGDNTNWTIERSTAGVNAMVPGYEGFVIKNGTTNTRAFAFNGSLFGAYATSNMNAGGYNFFLDFFVETEPVTETYTLEIAGYGDSEGGYYLIASPVAIDPATVVDPVSEEHMILTGEDAVNYDLYYFDESKDDEWRNYKSENFNLQPGTGYLYAHKRGGNFALVGVPYSGDGKVTLQKTAGAGMEGWNLVGNPYGQTAYIDRDFYVMNADGNEIIEATSDEIAPMQGFFVIAEENGEELQISTVAPTNPGSKIVMNVSNARRSVIDRAMVRFGEGRTLPKFMLNNENTKIYIAEGNEEYAVVRSINECTTPVSFRAAENGTYTLSITAEDVDFTYFHLIDNMTGNDIDLLSTPSYTFEASTTDYTQRFRLVYVTIDGVGENNGETFAFFNGNEWVVNNEGEATLQVVDVTGRLISSETVNGTATVSLNQPSGVYMLRLVNGNDMKVQKVVVR